MKYIKQTYLKEIEESELDFINQDAILGHNEDGHDFEWIITTKEDAYWYNESQEIEIDLVIETLKELKKDGANYVEIIHHGDHHGYIFNGLHMGIPTKEEIGAYKKAKKMANKKVIEEKISKLEGEISKLKKL